ncbi:MAG TPA: ABC transporter permease [Hyalangium sp.]|nr:ABC transporter permease [Hyalangium sp.]
MALLGEDLRFAARLFRKSPGFTAVAILTLALAIGANTAIFSVVNRVLLQPLPLKEPHRLFWVVRHDGVRDTAPLSVPQYAFLLRQERPFSELAAWPLVDGGFNLSGEGPPERLVGARVTHSFFEVLGIPPALGRGFLPEEDVEGGPRVVVLSHELWQRRFGGSPGAVGRSITLNDEPYTVIGVAPPGFDEPVGAQLWTPLQLNLGNVENAHFLVVVGRLKPGEDPAQVGSWVKAQFEQLRASRPGTIRPWHWLDAGELQTVRFQGVRSALLVLMGAVGLVLLIACVNLANLQLARITDRERELTVRIALGARPGRIARQLLTESVALALLGGALGLVLAAWALPVLLALAPVELALPQSFQLDSAALLFTLGVSLLAGLLFGLLPAWQASRMDPRHSLHVRARRRILRFSGGYTRWLLLVGQVALAVILLVGATLLVKSLVLLRAVPPGFDTRDVWTIKLSIPKTRSGSPEAFEVLARRIMERVRALPAVQAVGFAQVLPMESELRLDLTREDRRPGESNPSDQVPPHYRPVTRGYFEALKIGLLRGRLMDNLDQHESPPVAVINETAARLYWPGEDPLGRRITLGRSISQYTDEEPREIIGVVTDVHERSLREAPTPIVYIPMGQVSEAFYARFIPLLPHNLVIRAPGALEALMAAVQQEIWAVDPALPVTSAVSMEEIVSRRLGPQRFNAVLLAVMAGLALALATMGVYGVRTYLENQRAREIAVRLALGATRGAVAWLVVRQGMSAVVVGAVLGLLGAARLTGLIEHLLFSVSPVDPGVFLSAPALLVGAALVATWVPAWRASRMDPMVALRAD